MKKVSQEEFIFRQMKKVFELCQLPIELERHQGGLNLTTGLFHPEGPYKEVMMASYSPEMKLININSVFASTPILQDKLADLLELLNATNQLLVSGFLRFRRDMNRIDVSAGLFLAGDEFDGRQFKRLLDHVLDIGHKFYPILQDFLGGTASKDDALQLIDQVWPRPETKKG